MDSNQLLTELTPIFRDVLDNESINLTTGTSAADVDEWDSLSHIQLVVNIEKHFKIRFSSTEIHQWATVGDLINTIIAKKNG